MGFVCGVKMCCGMVRISDMIGVLSRVAGVIFGQRGIGGRVLWRGTLGGTIVISEARSVV
jgi:hypothetical protein